MPRKPSAKQLAKDRRALVTMVSVCREASASGMKPTFQLTGFRQKKDHKNTVRMTITTPIEIEMGPEAYGKFITSDPNAQGLFMEVFFRSCLEPMFSNSIKVLDLYAERSNTKSIAALDKETRDADAE